MNLNYNDSHHKHHSPHHSPNHSPHSNHISGSSKKEGKCTLYQFENSIMPFIGDNGKSTSYFIENMNNFGKTFFNHISIFSDDKRGTIAKDKEKVTEILFQNNDGINNKFSLIPSIYVKAIGSMLGMAIGDSMGARLEFLPCDYGSEVLLDMGNGPGGKFNLLPGQWTDDTAMGLCLADSLLVNMGKYDPHDLMNRFYAWWLCGYNNAFRNNAYKRASVGLGGNISDALSQYLKDRSPCTTYGDKSTSGNGSIMRNAAVPICFHSDINKAMEVARMQSLLTHQGDEAKECCALLTHIVVKLLNNENLFDVLDNLGKTFKTDCPSVMCLANSEMEGGNPDRDWNWKNNNFRYSESRRMQSPGYIGSYAMDAMAMALHQVYHTDNFKDAIIKTVNLKGDADSVGSVVGQIAGAAYGVLNINKEWIRTIYDWDDGEIALRGYMLANIMSGKSSVL